MTEAGEEDLTGSAQASKAANLLVRERYAEERKKRLRQDGVNQYRRMTGELADYLNDPLATEETVRPARTDMVDTVVIGAGFSGILAAVHLLKNGVGNILIIDKARDFGGTWYWNRYPGAACDIESYIYLPLLEETGYIPTEKYARQPEILQYTRHVAQFFGLYPVSLFATEVMKMTWDGAASRWVIETDKGDKLGARFVCMANGNPLHRPKLPGVEGIESFSQKAFHTSRWDYEYTHGLSDGRLTGLSDKRVGLVGTGATAVQVVPQLGKWAKELFVFQRTPSSIDIRANRQTDPQWAEGLEPGWQKRRMINFTTLLSGGRQDEDLVSDGWTQSFWRSLTSQPGAEASDLAQLLEASDFEKMEEIRARVSAVVKDAATAEALKPWYRRLCKRPCFHDDYLETFNRPNVHLVDTQGRGVERIYAGGVVAAGRKFDLDCLIFATGFEFGTDFASRIGFDVVGKNGVSLRTKWASGAATLHGMLSRDFPNCLIISMVQAGTTPNIPHMLDEQAQHAAYIIKTCLNRGIRTVEPTLEAQTVWVEEIIRLAKSRAKQIQDCTPGYLNNEGAPDHVNFSDSFYAGGALKFMAVLRDWRVTGQMEGLEFT